MHTDATSERLRALLARMGAPEDLARPVHSRLGPAAAERLAEDPWLLLHVPGVTVEQADHAARLLLGEPPAAEDPRRGRALVCHLMRRAARAGHTAVERERLGDGLSRLGAAGPALDAALAEGEVLEFTVLPDSEEGDPETGSEEPGTPERYYSLPGPGRAEQRLGEGLDRLLASGEPVMDAATAAETAEAAARRHGFEPPSRLAAACATAALRNVCVLAHDADSRGMLGPLLVCLAEIAEQSGTSLAAAAPTAAGASALSGALPAGSTVRPLPLGQLLEAQGPDVFSRGHTHPLQAGMVVVSGAMALDVALAAALVEACADGTHLVLLADPGEMPSAGPGQVLADVVASGLVTTAALPGTERPGPLARLAGSVAGGELGRVSSPEREVALVPADSAAAAAHRATQLITDSIPRAAGIAAEDTVLLTTAQEGECGAAALNAACKERLNPGPGTHAGFDPGDRVVLTGAGPGHLPGDTGVLHEVAAEGAVVELAGGHRVVVDHPRRLRHAWALPVAAAHGGHWPAAVAVFAPDVRYSRPQVYTALTRALRHLSVVHAAGPGLASAVRDVPRIMRHTRLAHVLREA